MPKSKSPEHLLVGHVYRYSSPDSYGFGHTARGSELSAEMRELDLSNGTVVEVDGLDDATGWPVIHWNDSKGIDRRTTIDPGEFGDLFTEAT